MVSDSITGNVPIPSAPINGKKKRAKSAKLKQCKKDVRREQRLSSGLVKNKAELRSTQSQASIEAMAPRREGENVGLNHESDLESNSSSSFASSVYAQLIGHESENFTGSSSGSSSGDCCSGDITEDDDDCLDDWEAVADALAADEKPKNQDSGSPREHEANADTKTGHAIQIENSKPRCERGVPKAWRPDDAFRPHILPSLAKQLSFSSCGGDGGVLWVCNSLVSPLSVCPICCDDLDLTDTSFLPCLCGFRLCLFCHKRILEGDGRCPGCRKSYEDEAVETQTSVNGGSLTFQLPHSRSMITRS